MNSILQIVPPQLRSLAKRIGFFILGTVLTVFYAQLANAQTTASNAPVRTAYSPATLIAAAIGAVITILFFRGMYLVLSYASKTYGLGDEDDGGVDEKAENNTLLFGAIGWVIGSAVVIASYGLGWGFLYIGPIICLLGPIVPIVAMNLDIKKYRRILSERANRYKI